MAAVKEIDVCDSDVRDLTGIACFTALEELDCDGCELTVLDVSSNNLTTLDLSKNTALTSLSCYGNNLTRESSGLSLRIDCVGTILLRITPFFRSAGDQGGPLEILWMQM